MKILEKALKDVRACLLVGDKSASSDAISIIDEALEAAAHARAEAVRVRRAPPPDKGLGEPKQKFEDTFCAEAAILSALAHPAVPEGLSEWGGWDQSRPPWGETKHKDAVLYELFRGPWSAEDAATLIRFIDRTWGKFAPKRTEADNG